ncbi:isoleucine--tRNA ligase [Nakamurella leprariae]|uniref:Isoleucine--tRNA ligase n=1 Tax=Nakamurella leprariae TaxID=2803911 RepID=A0A938YJZ0_9ACTN|nr:isoleucine--tRNA ligase [Nakamurella leprariae]MBM9469263.1 isoleucine--tRNA ligase [Nakamurella leprariae]
MTQPETADCGTVDPATGSPRGYPRAGADSVDPHPSFPALEHQVLDFWRTDGTFQASVDQRPAGEHGDNEFVFYDGPPFANGLPHYGHLLTGYVKDVVPRYQTMRGRRVERRFGWDTHGLPAEVEAERQLGIKHKSEIEALGVEQFNDACRTSVLRYTHEWQEYVTRQARWVDFSRDYKTLDLDYMESVMWAFKTLWDKGLVYEGYRVLWYCWRCETPLSATETRMDDVYRPRQDPAVTVPLRLRSDDPVLDGAQALVWTTTPWTLPSNLAAAVNPDVDYVVVQAGHDAPRQGRYLLAAARVGAYTRELGEEPQELGRWTGAQLVGTRYVPPFDFFTGTEQAPGAGGAAAHQVLPADYVTTEDGTGVVHIAPAFGEDDKAVTDAAGIVVVNPVDAQGRFTSLVPPYEGMQVFEANPQIIGDLKDAGLLFRRETYDHPYPHCWRCDTPLIQRAVSSWFVAVTKFRDRMVELNQQIDWTPSHIRDGQFGKWLAGSRDWSISRNRFWGSPIPVWVSDDPSYPRVDVYGSLDELERDFGDILRARNEREGVSTSERSVRPTDLHRPYIDELTRPNPDDPTGTSTMRRVPEVLDCWFESGSMPYAQVHYPFENRTWFEEHHPGDFIVEYNGQTRGWFYTLHVLATALFDRPAFRTVIAHGIVLGDDGLKMSKSRRNYPDVGEVFERDGSDAMRWFLMSSPILRGGDLVVTEAGIRESVRQAVLPLWNAWNFLALYANAAGVAGSVRTDSTDPMDRYILGRTAQLRDEVTGQLDAYDLAGACATVREYLEVLTNWYVRRSRQRFWDGDVDAIDTLHTVLERVCRLVAPLLPLTSEVIWRGLTGGRSVHLADWVTADELPSSDALRASVTAMDQVREIASVALSVRKEARLRVRQPLSSLTVAVAEPAALQPFLDVLRDEVNVRSVELTELAEHDDRVIRTLTVNARAAGPRLGKQVQQVIKASKAGDWSVADDGSVVCGGITLQDGEFNLDLASARGSAGGAAIGVLRDGGFVSLATELDEDLIADGLVRDVARGVQDLRKQLGLDVSDRITLTVQTEHPVAAAAVQGRRQWLADQVLATEVTTGAVPDGIEGSADVTAGTGVDAAVRVLVARA